MFDPEHGEQKPTQEVTEQKETGNIKEAYEELDLPENEKKLYEISFFVKSKIDFLKIELCKESADRKSNIDFKSLQEKIKIIWPDFEGQRNKPNFKIPKEMLPIDISEVVVIFETNSSESGRFKGQIDIRLPLQHLMDAKSEQDIKNACSYILQTLFHEVEHIKFEGADLESDDPEDVFAYLSNPGEIRAHAKEYAFLYCSVYPNQEFDIDKMKEIISLSESGKSQTIHKDRIPKIRNYLIRFGDGTAEKYKEFGDVLEVNKQIIDLITKFVSEMKSLDVN